jgi:hypothetical protein
MFILHLCRRSRQKLRLKCAWVSAPKIYRIWTWFLAYYFLKQKKILVYQATSRYIQILIFWIPNIGVLNVISGIPTQSNLCKCHLTNVYSIHIIRGCLYGGDRIRWASLLCRADFIPCLHERQDVLQKQTTGLTAIKLSRL